MELQKIVVERLIPADYNPRKDLKPGDAEYEKLRRSIEQFGYVEPVIWKKPPDGWLAVIKGSKFCRTWESPK